jgi:hypothetical protein
LGSFSHAGPELLPIHRWQALGDFGKKVTILGEARLIAQTAKTLRFHH